MVDLRRDAAHGVIAPIGEKKLDVAVIEKDAACRVDELQLVADRAETPE